VVLGLGTRAAFTHRMPLTFVLVAAVSLALLLLGWRAVARLVARSRGQSA
jgi:membrane protein implicated in regulation of membrane protease activity